MHENDLYTIRELLMSYGRKDRKTITIVGHEIIISNCVQHLFTYLMPIEMENLFPLISLSRSETG